MSRDLVAEVQPAIDLAQIKRALTKQYAELRDAETREQRTSEAAAKAREDAARRRLDVGRLLVEARKAWPARGPKAKGWGDFLRDHGIEERSARDWMALAGYVEQKISEPEPTGSEIPTRREIQEARKPIPPAVPDLTDEAEEEEDGPLTIEGMNQIDREVAAESLRLPAAAWTPEERQEIRRADIQRFQPPKMETREDKTRRLISALLAAQGKLDEIASIHLTDATTSDVDFETAKRTWIAIVRRGLDELEAAGALDAPEPRKRQLSILDGGKPA